MISFLQDLTQFRFLQFSLITAVLCSISCGMIGSFVVVRKSTYIVGAIAHSIMGGLGFARYANTVWGWQWMTPTIGALIAALVSSSIIAFYTIQRSERIDTILSAIWALGMALGISFLVATPGYSADLMSYLFGDILMVSKQSLWEIAILDVVILILGLISYEKLVAISFNPQMARLKGIRVELYESLFIILTALTVVMLVRVVGIILVIALITIPAATAARLSKRLPTMILLAIAFCLLYTIGGLIISYAPGLPAGPTMIEFGVIIYAIVSLITWRHSKTREN